MTFQIWKTSDDFIKPCEQASLAWEEKNEYGWKKRIWTIEINSIEELMKLTEGTDEKRVVVHAADGKYGPSIEIYDDYRE